jgi:hypothetical protein
MGAGKRIMPIAKNNTSGELAVEEFDPPPQARPKRRACLRCQTPFESGWAGERICTKCKHSSAWRGGEPS